jgi:hypothetical protein
VSLEVGLCGTLLVTAGLLIASFVRLMAVRWTRVSTWSG